MKHVFCIHSHITQLMMHRIIQEKRIDKNDIIVFSFRKFQLGHNQYKVVHLPSAPELSYDPSKNLLNKLTQHLQVPFKTAKWLIKVCVVLKFKKAELYIPHSNFHAWNILKSFMIFQHFNYIEEGTFYYLKENPLQIKRKTPYKYRIQYLGLLKQRVAFSKDAKHSYVFSKEVISDIPNPIYIDFKNSLHEFRNTNSTKEIIIAIDGASTNQQIISRDQHIAILSRICEHINYHYWQIPVLFKLHPNQVNTHEEAQAIRNLLKNKLDNCKELAQETMLEAYIGNKNKIIFTGISSLGLYAYLLNFPIQSYIFEYARYNIDFSEQRLNAKYPHNYVAFLKQHNYLFKNKLNSK